MRFSELKLFVRNLLQNRLYSMITIGGFAISLTFVFLLSMYIRQELVVDDFQVNKDRIFRMTGEDAATWGALIGREMKGSIPEIEDYTRVYVDNNSYAVTPDENKLMLTAMLVDTAFWRMFSFSLVEGRPFQAKKEVVVSRSFARKVFGQESPLGKDLRLNEQEGWTVVGMIEDLPYDTHFDWADVFKTAGTFDRIQEAYSRFIDGRPFDSGFMDQTINTWYEDSACTARLIGFFGCWLSCFV